MFKRVLEDKRFALFFSLLALLGLTLLAGALDNVTFKPVTPLYREQVTAAQGDVVFAKTIAALANLPAWKLIAFGVAIVLFIGLIFSLLSPEARKRLLRMIVRGAITILLVWYIVKTNPGLVESLFPQLAAAPAAPNSEAETIIAPPVFEPPQVSGVLSFFVTFGIVLAVTALLIGAYLLWRRYNAMLQPSTLERIAKVARASLHELAHSPSPDAIIRCYENMSEAVHARRGLERNYAMTAAEFALKLEGAGLPAEPVQRLTRLFESARYSSHSSTQKDVDEAVLCLTTILHSCGEQA